VFLIVILFIIAIDIIITKFLYCASYSCEESKNKSISRIYVKKLLNGKKINFNYRLYLFFRRTK